MPKRFVYTWFRYLKTDWCTRRDPALKDIPFVLSAPDHGRMVVTSVNALAALAGIHPGIAVADARAIITGLHVVDDPTGLAEKLLKGLGEWFIRYTPVVAVDMPDGLILDATGCAPLWGGEEKYLADISNRMQQFGYQVHTAMADTIGAAWAMARFAQSGSVIEPGAQAAALMNLPAAALRLEPATVDLLHKLGIGRVASFINMPRPALRRRFGKPMLERLNLALGNADEVMIPLEEPALYKEWLPCLEPIATAGGIAIALQQTLDGLCGRLVKAGKGSRVARFCGYRVDGKIEMIEVATHQPSYNPAHLFKLFEIKISGMEPALGIELFTLEATRVEDATVQQEALWSKTGGLEDVELSQLLDRIGTKIGAAHIKRYVPDEHYWPERSFKPAACLLEKLQTSWQVPRPRPLQVLAIPAPIEVTAPVPDYPPMMFRYKGQLHKIMRADGAERIEQEWWLEEGQHRDYYSVEDEAGNRYWLFRLGHYDAARSYQWFIHGFFA